MINHGITWISSKVAPRCFNLSYGYGNISIRDQVVRAQLLINDLKEINKLCKNKQEEYIKKVLIVGAGFAGTVAAISAAKCGFDVTLVDSQEGPLSLQKTIDHRYVGAFMYDWPCVESNLQHYPPDVVLGYIDKTKYWGPFWEAALPITAKELARQHLVWFADEKVRSSRVTEYYGSDTSSGQRYIKMFISWARRGVFHPSFSGEIFVPSASGLPGKKDKKTIEADVLIVAAGMGAEKCEVECKCGKKLIGKKFWEKGGDNLRLTRDLRGNALVIGGGDGALQDVLRLMTRHDDVLSIITSMERCPVICDAINSVKPLLMAIQLQNTLAFSHNLFGAHEKFDKRVGDIAKKIVTDNRSFFLEWAKNNLREGLGKYRVYHFINGNSFTKSYLINKFIIHIISEIDKKNMSYRLVKNFDTRKHMTITSGSDVEAGDIFSFKIDASFSYKYPREEEVAYLSVNVGVDGVGGLGGVLSGEYKYSKEFNAIESLGNFAMPKVMYF